MNVKYMKIALEEAQKAFYEGEIPVGAVIVYNDKVIAQAHNLKEKTNCSINHAEIIAIKEACNKLGTWRLNDCDVYLTMEPCLMCCGALIQSRINKVYYLLNNDKFGGIISMDKIINYSRGNHKFEYEKVNDAKLERISTLLLKEFFLSKR